MRAPSSLVTIVDDYESVRESLPDLLRVSGFVARAFSSAEEFLASGFVGQTKCLILHAGAAPISRQPNGDNCRPAVAAARIKPRL